MEQCNSEGLKCTPTPPNELCAALTPLIPYNILRSLSFSLRTLVPFACLVHFHPSRKQIKLGTSRRLLRLPSKIKKKKEEKDSSGEMFESEDKAGQSRRAISFTASLIAPYYGVFILAFVSVHWWWQSI